MLEAAHIKPYSETGPHLVSNGLLLRSDLHTLFDDGYVTVTEDLRVEVSERIKEEFENGREYYQHRGKPLVMVPGGPDERPSAEFLRWHNEHRLPGLRSRMPDDQTLRLAAFDAVRRLTEIRGDLTSNDLRGGFEFQGERIPLINPQRGIFKPRQMQFLLSIRTVFPRSGARVWYDDQRDVHRQIYEGDDAVDYAFMGNNPDAADNRWLREAMENRVPVIYFLGVAPGCYQAFLPTFIVGWDPSALKARVAFGMAEQSETQLLDSWQNAATRYAR